MCPEADIIAVRVADSQGTVLEGDFMLAVRSLVKWMSVAHGQGGRQIDVINLSLGYYHETPEDDLFDRTLSELLVAARRRGCAVVCSAGNDATDRPTFPAALWRWPDLSSSVHDPARRRAAPLGRRAQPERHGGAVQQHRPVGDDVCPGRVGAEPQSAVSTAGMQPGTCGTIAAACRGRRSIRMTSRGGFALWSGTSFAAPYVGGDARRASWPGR